jgi:hypothetical protein
MGSPLYPTFEKRIRDACEALQRRQVDPWAFFHTGLEVRNHLGRTISMSGVKFMGSPEIVFWSRYIEPFMEDIAVQEFSAARAMASERGVDLGELLPEVRGLLDSNFGKIFQRMTEIDRQLRGEGFPNRVAPTHNAKKGLHVMREFLDAHLSAELRMPLTSSSSSKLPARQPPQPENAIFVLKPSFYGVGIDLRAGWKKVTAWWKSSRGGAR